MQAPPSATFTFGFDASIFHHADDTPTPASSDAPSDTPSDTPSDAPSDCDRHEPGAAQGNADYDGPSAASGRLPPEFLAFRTGPDWPRARAQMQASIEALRAFATRHALQESQLEVFQQRLMANDGDYYESYLPQLFGRGKRLLAACAEGLADDGLPAEERCKIFRQLVREMARCGMRIVDDLARAQAALAMLRDGNLRRRATSAVRSILEQEGQWINQHTPYRQGRRRDESLEVHFVVAAIEELRLDGRAPRRDDVFIAYDGGRVADLVEPLRARLTQTLTPVRVARQLAEECLSRVSSDLADWLGGQPLDLASGTRRDAEGETSHCARLSMLVQGLEAAYGPLTMDAFVRTGSDATMTLHRDATLVAVQIRRNLAAQGLAVPPKEQALHEWAGTGGPRRVILVDDDVAIVREGSADAAVDALPQARHLRRMAHEGLLGSPRTGTGEGISAGARSVLLRAALRHADVGDVARLPPGWLGHWGDALALAERLGVDGFRGWCKDHWREALPGNIPMAMIDAAERRGDGTLVIALLHVSDAQRAFKLWCHETMLSHCLARLAIEQTQVADAYLQSLASALPLLDASRVATLLSALRAEGSARPLLREASLVILGRYLALVEAAARENKLRGAALATTLFSASRDRPHWLRTLVTQDDHVSRLSMILGTVRRLVQDGPLDKASVGRFLIEPEAFCPEAAGDDRLREAASGLAAPLCDGMAGDHDATVRVVLHALLAVCRTDPDDGSWLHRMLRASHGGAGPTALGQALTHGAISAVNCLVEGITAALGQALLSLPQALDLLRAEPPPDGDGIGPLALALRNGHLGTVEVYWKRMLEMHARGILTADQVRPLLRAESAGGVPALAEAFENQIPDAIDRYMAQLRSAVAGAKPMSPQQLEWLHLRDAEGQLFWPPPGGSPVDGWPVLKRYLRGLRALVEDQALSPPQLQALLARRFGHAPSLLGRLMSLEDRSTLSRCLDELASWPSRQQARHAPALEAVLDIEELGAIATTTERYPGLHEVLQTLVSEVTRPWLDGSALRHRLLGRTDTPTMMIAFDSNQSDVIAALAAATLRAARERRLPRRFVRELLEAMLVSSGRTAAHVAFARGYDEALKVWLEAVLQARARTLLSDGDLRELLTAYGEDEQPGRDAALAAGHQRCLDVWRDALRRSAQAGWLSAEDVATLDPPEVPPDA